MEHPGGSRLGAKREENLILAAVLIAVIKAAEVIGVSKGCQPETEEEAIEGPQPSMPRREAIPASRAAGPGFIPALGEECAERKRPPSPFLVRIAEERFKDRVREAQIDAWRDRFGAFTSIV